MGEVYKAFDLILNQIVALKFLGGDHFTEAALMRFRNEVRIARQVSHPNVCRVYDLGVAEGLHFLSMEYIDGEDLASLLRRIGRLPQDKAIEFTRKICLGLHSAHERGVLHRDLKPANIMIDGRGQVRITDFGLAALEAEIPLSDLRSGTPAYMSPEQKAGDDVTTRSDIYSLGLVLHEMFTGKPRRDTESSPSEIVKDLDATIERVILRCLEEEPRRRPQTALSVAMSLPGADPIAAALAAGETPSPEMVAASEEKEGFRTQTAVLCFAGIVGCVLLGFFLAGKFGFLARVPLPLPPEALDDRAQQLLKTLGYDDAPTDYTSAFACCDHSNETNLNKLDPARRDEVLKSHQPPIIHFWYRQSLKSFPPGDGGYGLVTETSPPNYAPGMILVDLDATGRLLRLQVQPWKLDGEKEPVNWESLFSVAGLDFKRFTSITPESIPPTTFDSQLSWRGTYAQDLSEMVTVNAASWRGRPVYFEAHQFPVEEDTRERSRNIGAAVIAAAMSFFAWRNWRSGRMDRRGAGVLTISMLLLTLAAGGGIGIALRNAAFSGLVYVAVEPFARRYWPDSLISWTRFAHGQLRNPLVASHLLAAILGASMMSYIFQPMLNSLLTSLPFTEIQEVAFSNIASPRALLVLFTGGILAGLAYLTFFVLARLGMRSLWVADLLAATLFNVLAVSVGIGLHMGSKERLIAGAVLILPSLVWIAMMRRFGFLTLLAVWALQQAIMTAAVTTGGWIGQRVIPLHLIPLAIAAWAVWVIVSAEHKKMTIEQ
jgi:serine/threonine-protein kinase